MVLPKSLELPGKATSLLDALANTSDRRRQMATVYAYWRLAEEAGEYHYSWQHVQYLKLLSEVIAGVEQGADAGAARDRTLEAALRVARTGIPMPRFAGR